MSYYSDVAIAVTHRTAIRMLFEAYDAGEKCLSFFNDALQENVRRGNWSPDVAVYHWKNVKWYRDDPEYFPEVDFITKFLKTIDDGYEFVRIGEEDSDIETVYALGRDHYIDVERKIVIV